MNARSSPCILRDDHGLSTVEYVVILVLIAIAAIGTWRAFGSAIMAKIDSSNAAIRDIEGNGSGPGQGPSHSNANPSNANPSNPSQSNPSSNTNTPSQNAAQSVTPSDAPAKQAKGKIAD